MVLQHPNPGKGSASGKCVEPKNMAAILEGIALFDALKDYMYARWGPQKDLYMATNSTAARLKARSLMLTLVKLNTEIN